MQNLGGSVRTMFDMDPDFSTARATVQESITRIMQQRVPQPVSDRKLRAIVTKLDEWLIRTANTKEDYMNPETIEIRLQNLIRRPLNQSQQHQQLVNDFNSLSVGAQS